MNRYSMLSLLFSAAMVFSLAACKSNVANFVQNPLPEPNPIELVEPDVSENETVEIEPTSLQDERIETRFFIRDQDGNLALIPDQDWVKPTVTPSAVIDYKKLGEPWYYEHPTDFSYSQLHPPSITTASRLSDPEPLESDFVTDEQDAAYELVVDGVGYEVRRFKPYSHFNWDSDRSTPYERYGLTGPGGNLDAGCAQLGRKDFGSLGCHIYLEGTDRPNYHRSRVTALINEHPEHLQMLTQTGTIRFDQVAFAEKRGGDTPGWIEIDLDSKRFTGGYDSYIGNLLMDGYLDETNVTGNFVYETSYKHQKQEVSGHFEGKFGHSTAINKIETAGTMVGHDETNIYHGIWYAAKE